MKTTFYYALPSVLAGLIYALLLSPSEAVMVGHWTFDAGGGTVINDSSGSGNHGTLINPKAGTWTGGIHGSALYFDGTTGGSSTRVEIPDSPSLRIAAGITFSAWVRCDDIFRDAPILAKESGGGSYWFGAFGLASDEGASPGNFGVLLAKTGYWDVADRNQGAIPQGTWVHLASTWDGTTVRHYLNGSQLPETNTFTGPIKSISALLAIGVNSVPKTTAFKGAIDDLRLYDHALAAGEILALYELPRPLLITAVDVEGNDARVTWTVQPGSAYILQASSLIPEESTGEIKWTDRTETIEIPEDYPSSTFHHLDPGALPGTEALFYRVKRLP